MPQSRGPWKCCGTHKGTFQFKIPLCPQQSLSRPICRNYNNNNGCKAQRCVRYHMMYSGIVRRNFCKCIVAVRFLRNLTGSCHNGVHDRLINTAYWLITSDILMLERFLHFPQSYWLVSSDGNKLVKDRLSVIWVYSLLTVVWHVHSYNNNILVYYCWHMYVQVNTNKNI